MLQIGDIVQLNSGGLEMKIVGFENDEVVVRYEAEDRFPRPCLKKVTEGTSWAEGFSLRSGWIPESWASSPQAVCGGRR